MPFSRKSAEEKAAQREAKEQRKRESKERLRGIMDDARRERQEKNEAALTAALTVMLGPDEQVEALFKTGDFISKHVVFTSSRLIVGSQLPEHAESVLYRAITGFSTSNFVTKDVELTVQGRRDKLELAFKSEEDRSEALRVLRAHIV